MRIPLRVTLATITTTTASSPSSTDEYNLLGLMRDFYAGFRPSRQSATSDLRFASPRENESLAGASERSYALVTRDCNDGEQESTMDSHSTNPDSSDPTCDASTDGDSDPDLEEEEFDCTTPSAMEMEDSSPASTSSTSPFPVSSTSAQTAHVLTVPSDTPSPGSDKDPTPRLSSTATFKTSTSTESGPVPTSMPTLDDDQDLTEPCLSMLSKKPSADSSTSTSVAGRPAVPTNLLGAKVLSAVAYQEPATSTTPSDGAQGTSSTEMATVMWLMPTPTFTSDRQSVARTSGPTSSSSVAQSAAPGFPSVGGLQSHHALTKNQLAAILGSVLGFCFLVLMSLLLLFVLRRRRRRELRKRLLIQHPADYPDLGSTPAQSIKESDGDLSPALTNFPGLRYDAPRRSLRRMSPSPGSDLRTESMGGPGPDPGLGWRRRTSVASSAFSPWLSRSQTYGADGELNECNRSSKGKSMKSVGGRTGWRLSHSSLPSSPMNVAFPNHSEKAEGGEEDLERGTDGGGEGVGEMGEKGKRKGKKRRVRPSINLGSDPSFMEFGGYLSSLAETNVDEDTDTKVSRQSIVSQKAQKQRGQKPPLQRLKIPQPEVSLTPRPQKRSTLSTPRPSSGNSLDESKRMSGLGFHWPRPPSINSTLTTLSPPLSPASIPSAYRPNTAESGMSILTLSAFGEEFRRMPRASRVKGDSGGHVFAQSS